MTDIGRTPDWHARAACRTADPELFFSEGTTGPARQATARAKRICSTCPVRMRCLNWALRHGAAYGIWGGQTEEERRTLRVTLIPRPR